MSYVPKGHAPRPNFNCHDVVVVVNTGGEDHEAVVSEVKLQMYEWYVWLYWVETGKPDRVPARFVRLKSVDT